MTGDGAAAPLIGGVGLLESAINYTLGSLHLVTPDAMSRPTPCRDWDLRTLLEHMNDSLVALHEAIDVGRVDVVTVDRDLPHDTDDPVALLRNRACQLLGAWTNANRGGLITVADQALTTGIVSGTGAIEIAVHGWDVAEACGHHRPIPEPLAEEMLRLSPLFVSDADRPVRFAAPVNVPPLASAADRLLAYLGRHPTGSSPKPG